MNVEFKDVDNSVFKVLKEWNEFVKTNNEQSPPNPVDIKYYIIDKWWKKIIPMFIYRLLFKPNKTFKNCYPSSIDLDFVQQRLSDSEDKFSTSKSPKGDF
jgi:hypothetical protein